MNLDLVLPQIPFLLVILAAFIVYGIMVRREILSGAKVWQGGIVIGLITVGLSALNSALFIQRLAEIERLAGRPVTPPTVFDYAANPMAMAFCSAYCVFISHQMLRVRDTAKWMMGDTKILLRVCPASKLPDADALILPTGTRLEMRYGIPAQVKNAGGDAIANAAKTFAPVGVGKVIVTPAGTLAVGKIYHVAVYEGGKAIKADVLKRFVGQALLAARKDGAESVCIPLGAYPGLTVEAATVALTETVLKHHKPFAEIVLCVVEARDDRDALKATRRVLGGDTAVSVA